LVVGLLSLSGSVALADGVQPDTLTPFPSNNPPPAAPTPAAGSESALVGTETGPGFKGGTIGIEIGIPAGGGGSVGATIFVGASAAIRVEMTMLATLAPSFSTGLLLELEADFRKYLLHYDRVHLYIAPGVRFGNEPISRFDLALLGSVGVEVYIFERFAIGGQTGLAFDFRDIPGSASATLTTGTTQLFAAYYF
jgi:hypothetical protein